MKEAKKTDIMELIYRFNSNQEALERINQEKGRHEEAAQYGHAAYILDIISSAMNNQELCDKYLKILRK